LLLAETKESKLFMFQPIARLSQYQLYLLLTKARNPKKRRR